MENNKIKEEINQDKGNKSMEINYLVQETNTEKSKRI